MGHAPCCHSSCCRHFHLKLQKQRLSSFHHTSFQTSILATVNTIPNHRLRDSSPNTTSSCKHINLYPKPHTTPRTPQYSNTSFIHHTQHHYLKNPANCAYIFPIDPTNPQSTKKNSRQNSWYFTSYANYQPESKDNANQGMRLNPPAAMQPCGHRTTRTESTREPARDRDASRFRCPSPGPSPSFSVWCLMNQCIWTH